MMGSCSTRVVAPAPQSAHHAAGAYSCAFALPVRRASAHAAGGAFTATIRVDVMSCDATIGVKFPDAHCVPVLRS